MSDLDLAIDRLITAALEEDVRTGDITSEYFIPATSQSRARILAKDVGILSGTEVAIKVFHRVDPQLQVEVKLRDGDAFNYGDDVLFVTGPTRSLLTAELLSSPPPAAGTHVLSPDGSFTFSPAAGFAGTATFTYRVTDATTPGLSPAAALWSAPATVTLALNLPPSALSDL